jgi:hypothetical protein
MRPMEMQVSEIVSRTNLDNPRAEIQDTNYLQLVFQRTCCKSARIATTVVSIVNGKPSTMTYENACITVASSILQHTNT